MLAFFRNLLRIATLSGQPRISPAYTVVVCTSRLSETDRVYMRVPALPIYRTKCFSICALLFESTI